MSENDIKKEEVTELEDWLKEPQRTEVFQAFLDSLEPAKRVRTVPRVEFQNYATRYPLPR